MFVMITEDYQLLVEFVSLLWGRSMLAIKIKKICKQTVAIQLQCTSSPTVMLCLSNSRCSISFSFCGHGKVPSGYYDLLRIICIDIRRQNRYRSRVRNYFHVTHYLEIRNKYTYMYLKTEKTPKLIALSELVYCSQSSQIFENFFFLFYT